MLPPTEKKSSSLVREEHSESKTSKTRRKNVKYRFNLSKFINLFKETDEPFKL